MTKKKNVFANLISDIRNGSSHSVDFLVKEDVADCLSVIGIRVRKLFAPLLRLVYRRKTSIWTSNPVRTLTARSIKSCCEN